MKRIVCIITIVVLGISYTIAQDYEQAFKNVQQQFEQRMPNTQNNLKQYLDQYPYTTYEDEVRTMQGVLYTEKEKYKNAIKIFSKVKVKNLSRRSEPMYYFYLGYAYLQQKDYEKALPCMLRVKNKQSAYSLQATYYTGYAYYSQKNYPQALAEFLSIEQLGVTRWWICSFQMLS